MLSYGAEIWGWKKREEKSGENPEEVLEMGAGSEMANARIHDEGRVAKRSIKNKSREISLKL